jgi:hypothetical protein
MGQTNEFAASSLIIRQAARYIAKASRQCVTQVNTPLGGS